MNTIVYEAKARDIKMKATAEDSKRQKGTHSGNERATQRTAITSMTTDSQNTVWTK